MTHGECRIPNDACEFRMTNAECRMSIFRIWKLSQLYSMIRGSALLIRGLTAFEIRHSEFDIRHASFEIRVRHSKFEIILFLEIDFGRLLGSRLRLEVSFP